MIKISFELDKLLHPPHQEIFLDQSRFRVVAAGRRFGKSFLSVYILLRQAYSTPKGLYYFISPTFSQSRSIIWDVLKEKCIPELIAKINESRLEIELVNGAKIILKSSDRSSSMRGVSLNGVVMDEVSSFRDFTDTWQKIIRPALSDKQGFALFISSPSGRDHLYDLYQEAKTLPDWNSFQFTTIDGGYVPAAEIEAAKKDMDIKSFRSEFLATFESWDGLVVPDFTREMHFIHDFKLGDDETVLCGIDLNVMNMSCACCVYRNGTIVCFDELMGDRDTPSLVKSILRRFPNHKVITYPDASASQRSSIGAEKTSVTLLKEHFVVKKRSRNPLHKDRAAAFNAMVLSGDGTVRFRITPNCKSVIESLEKFSYDEDGKFDKSGYDHAYDGLTYCCYFFSPLTKRIAKVSGFRL